MKEIYESVKSLHCDAEKNMECFGGRDISNTDSLNNFILGLVKNSIQFFNTGVTAIVNFYSLELVADRQRTNILTFRAAIAAKTTSKSFTRRRRRRKLHAM